MSSILEKRYPNMTEAQKRKLAKTLSKINGMPQKKSAKKSGKKK